MAPASTSNALSTYLRLRPDARVDKLPFSDAFWPDLIGGKLGTFHHEYLVSCMDFDADWPSWEIHPQGDEIVYLLSGALDFILETPAGEQIVSLRHSGDFAFVPIGTWHTANILEKSRMLFITAGEGTHGRPRE
jgi:quercetin dioxygenase-like cupin family protein